MTQFVMVDTTTNEIIATCGQIDAPDLEGPVAETPAPHDNFVYYPWQQPVALSAAPSPTSVLKWLDQPVWIETLPLAEVVSRTIIEIDSAADKIIAEKIGNREREYTEAYADAAAYRDSGYSGDVPDTVADYAEIKGWTPQQAADDVIATGDLWKTAMREIRKNRLARKENCRNAASLEEVALAFAGWGRFEAAIRSQLGI